MNKCVTILLAGATAALGIVRGAAGEIIMTVSEVTLSGAPGSPAQILHDNGWRGFLLTLQADAESKTVGGYDFDTQNYGINPPFDPGIPVNWGITGVFAQAWPKLHRGSMPTPTGILPTTTSTSLSDSFAGTLASGVGIQAISPLESVDISDSPGVGDPVDPNPPYDHNPVPDTATIDYGIGNSLRGGVASVFGGNQTTELAVAFVISPSGSPVHVAGMVADGTQAADKWVLDFTFNAPLVAHSVLLGQALPEPGTLMMLGVGAGILLRRRRR